MQLPSSSGLCVVLVCSQACFGVPTIIIPNSVLQPPLVEAFTQVLVQHLKAAGKEAPEFRLVLARDSTLPRLLKG